MNNYVVVLNDDVDITSFEKNIISQGFDIIFKYDFGVFILKNNGKLDLLKKHKDVLNAKIEDTLTII